MFHVFDKLEDVIGAYAQNHCLDRDPEHAFWNRNVQLACIVMLILCWSPEGRFADNYTLHLFKVLIFNN